MGGGRGSRQEVVSNIRFGLYNISNGRNGRLESGILPQNAVTTLVPIIGMNGGGGEKLDQPLGSLCTIVILDLGNQPYPR